MHSPGLKAVFSYYTQTVKVTSEGEVHLSDEALSSLGMILEFLKLYLFGAIIQIYDPPSLRAKRRHPMHVTRPPERVVEGGSYEVEEPSYTNYEDDPHIPTKPARRKAQDSTALEEQAEDDAEHLSLTDFVPNLGYFAAGGLSGITSRTVTAPLDRLKVYLIAQTGSAEDAVQAAKKGAPLQATKHGVSTLWNACKELWAAGGIRSLFAGVSSP